jgi:histidine triad (HIT) family protein
MHRFVPKIITILLVGMSIDGLTEAFAQQSRPNSEYATRKAKQLAEESVFMRDLRTAPPSMVHYRDSLITVFTPNSVQAPVHLLAIPNKHIPTLNDMSKEESAVIGHCIWALKQEAAKKGIAETGYRIVINTNENAGQSVFHVHVHLLGGIRTGPMMEQTWRMMERVKLGKDSLVRTSAMRDSLLFKLMGTWHGKGTSFGLPTNIWMHWEPEMQYQYMKLSYRLEMRPTDSITTTFDGEAVYRPLPQSAQNRASQYSQYQGSWHDSGGEQHSITATAHGNSLVAVWGVPSGKMGKTTYTLLDPKRVEIVDYIYKPDGSWKEFNRNTVERVVP